MTSRPIAVLTCALILGGCVAKEQGKTRIVLPDMFVSGEMPPPVIRQPVLPEMLVVCRGHVLVPALGMTFVYRAAEAPTAGQFLREENLSAPYRIIAPGSRISQEHSGARLNVELDKYRRIIGLYCG